MNPSTITDLAAAQRAVQIAQADLNRSARRVFNIAESIKESRPVDEADLIEKHFGEWNSERNHIFWAETGFFGASLRDTQVRMETGYTLRNETNSFYLYFPVEWLSLSDEALNAVLVKEWENLLATATAAHDAEERKREWQRYQTYLSLKEEWEGKPAPQEPAAD